MIVYSINLLVTAASTLLLLKTKQYKLYELIPEVTIFFFTSNILMYICNHIGVLNIF